MSQNVTYEDSYSLKAPEIFVVAQTGLLPPSPSLVHIASPGSSDMLKNGHVKVSASGEINLQSGSSLIGMTSTLAQENIVVMNGLPGAITLTQGALPGSPQIKVNGLPPSVSLTVGPEPAGAAVKLEATGVNLKYGPPPAGADIALGPQGITLKYGPPGLAASVALGPQGVTVKAGPWSLHLGPEGFEVSVGPNKLSVQPQGISLNGMTLDLEATTSLSLQGLQIKETAAVQRQAKAPITMLG